ncbi:MAG: hypothetical protein RL091_2454 [Verrucomicrobiota bacterium]|jgi:hypothetical protein
MNNRDNVITPAALEADLKPKQVAAWFGYTCTKSFLNHCRTQGIPFRKHNHRVIRFAPSEVRDWRKKRGLGIV